MCVRGNCEAEVDQMVLPFPCLSDYALVFADGINIYLSHGHRDVPPMNAGDVYITGHTHVPLIEKPSYLHLNPGSVSLPKENSERGYIVYENRTFTFKTLAGKEYKQVTVYSWEKFVRAARQTAARRACFLHTNPRTAKGRAPPAFEKIVKTKNPPFLSLTNTKKAV